MTFDEITDILRSLDTHKAIGHDKLPTNVLKGRAEFLAPSTLYNSDCYTAECFPPAARALIGYFEVT